MQRLASLENLTCGTNTRVSGGSNQVTQATSLWLFAFTAGSKQSLGLSQVTCQWVRSRLGPVSLRSTCHIEAVMWEKQTNLSPGGLGQWLHSAISSSFLMMPMLTHPLQAGSSYHCDDGGFPKVTLTEGTSLSQSPGHVYCRSLLRATFLLSVLKPRCKMAVTTQVLSKARSMLSLIGFSGFRYFGVF